MLLEQGVEIVGVRKVSLCVIGETCCHSDVANHEENGLVEREDNDDDPPDVTKIVLDIDILLGRPWVHFAISGSPSCGRICSLNKSTQSLTERHSCGEGRVEAAQQECTGRAKYFNDHCTADEMA